MQRRQIMGDRDAIRRVTNREISRLELLMERYQVQAARAAMLIVHDKAQAKDVVRTCGIGNKRVGVDR